MSSRQLSAEHTILIVRQRSRRPDPVLAINDAVDDLGRSVEALKTTLQGFDDVPAAWKSALHQFERALRHLRHLQDELRPDDRAGWHWD